MDQILIKHGMNIPCKSNGIKETIVYNSYELRHQAKTSAKCSGGLPVTENAKSGSHFFKYQTLFGVEN